MNSIKVNTYTDHAQYQEPIIRSKFHNTIRYIFGVFVILFISAPLFIGGVSGIPFSIYELGAVVVSNSYNKQELGLIIISPFFSFAIAFVGLEFFKWGRHLTRPTSREFI